MSLEVYNLHRDLQNPKMIAKYGLISIEESFVVLRQHQHRYANVVVLRVKDVSEAQAGLLLSATNRLTLPLDGKEPEQGREEAAEMPVHVVFVRIAQYLDWPRRGPAQFSKDELAIF